MILIAECGSTKCDWVYVDFEGKIIDTIDTEGFNPNYDPPQKLSNNIRSVKEKQENVQSIHYYGAGCSHDKANRLVEEVLSTHFKEAEVHVDHDLMAVVDACTYPEKGVCCILGTGSNSCFFNGNSIEQKIPSLGYLIGDEGSGYAHGKELLKMYFYGDMDVKLKEKFQLKYGKLSRELFLEHLYNGNSMRHYIAGFMPFVLENKDDPAIYKLRKRCLRNFVETHIKCYWQKGLNLKVHFVGSVAFYQKELLQELLREHNFQLGSCIQRPIDQLTRKLPLRYKSRG